jgi:cytochrome c oxidase subunit IV
VAATTEHSDPHSHGADSAHGHGHGDEHGHGDGHGGHGTTHVLPMKVLLGTWGVLMVLTVLTVSVTSIDLGANLNLLVAMVIATIKATLVCLYFMHLRYDKLFHTVVFVSAILLALLFVSFALMDSTQYQTDVTWAPDDLSPKPY